MAAIYNRTQNMANMFGTNKTEKSLRNKFDIEDAQKHSS